MRTPSPSSQPGSDPELKLVERRASVRYSANLQTSCQRLAGPPNEFRWPARVRNISKGGIGLTLNRWFGAGTLLEFELQNTAQTYSSVMVVRVVHATPQPDGTWLVGCAFANELSDNELKALLSE